MTPGNLAPININHLAPYRSVTSANIYIKEFKGKEGLLTIKKEWHNLTDSMIKKRFYHMYEWYESYMNALEDDDSSVSFFLMHNEEKPTAIFPLKKTERKIFGFKFNVLGIPEHPHVDLSDFICNDIEGINKLLDLLISYLNKETKIKWDFIFLPRLLAESAIFHHFDYSRQPFYIYELIGKCDYLPCFSKQNIINKVSRNFRGSLRKARNKLLKEKNVEYLTSRMQEELLPGFEEFLEVEASGWKGEEGTKTAIKYNRKSIDFYKCLIAAYSKLNCCEINLLRVNGKCIAGQLCLLLDDEIYILKIGYNEKYSQLSPGNILLEKLVERCWEDGNIKFINFVTGSEWHANWKPSSCNVVRVYFFNKTYRGFVGFILKKCHQMARCVPPRYLNHFRSWDL
jgi:hypothetical protein